MLPQLRSGTAGKMTGRRKTAPAGIITSGDAARAGLKGAKVLSCDAAEGSRKLRRFSPDFGNGEVSQECVQRNPGVLEA
jgi:tRNA-binding EMAP/Myf-like protein